MANTDYNFQYTPLTGRLPGKSFVEQTERAINELARIVNEGAAQVETITNLANTANDNSEEALEKANEALETAGRVYITLPNLDDADSYFDSQLYYFANSHSANLPVQDTGFLEVKTNDTKTACEQVFVADTTSLCYFRHGNITSEEVGDETVYSVTWETWSSELASETYVQEEVNSGVRAANDYTDDKIEIGVPTGCIQAFAGQNSPNGWLLCDGSAVNRVTYAKLFAVIGTTYGGGNGSTTFNLPNLVNRMAVGAGGNYALGATGGEAAHALTVAELATHSHTFTGSAVTSGNQNANHTHGVNTLNVSGHFAIRSYIDSDGTQRDLASNSSGVFSDEDTSAATWTLPKASGAVANKKSKRVTLNTSGKWTGSLGNQSANHQHSVTAAGSNSNTGSGTAHNNMPPYIGLKYIIKY